MGSVGSSNGSAHRLKRSKAYVYCFHVESAFAFATKIFDCRLSTTSELDTVTAAEVLDEAGPVELLDGLEVDDDEQDGVDVGAARERGVADMKTLRPEKRSQTVSTAAFHTSIRMETRAERVRNGAIYFTAQEREGRKPVEHVTRY